MLYDKRLPSMKDEILAEVAARNKKEAETLEKVEVKEKTKPKVGKRLGGKKK